MSKARRNRKIREEARELNPKKIRSIARRIRRNRNPSKYDEKRIDADSGD